MKLLACQEEEGRSKTKKNEKSSKVVDQSVWRSELWRLRWIKNGQPSERQRATRENRKVKKFTGNLIHPDYYLIIDKPCVAFVFISNSMKWKENRANKANEKSGAQQSKLEIFICDQFISLPIKCKPFREQLIFIKAIRRCCFFFNPSVSRLQNILSVLSHSNRKNWVLATHDRPIAMAKSDCDDDDDDVEQQQ